MIVVLLAGYGAVYVPMRAKIDETTVKIAAAQKLTSLATALEESQAQARGFAKWLPKKTDAKEWLDYMHEGIRQFPLQLTKIESLAPRQVGPYQVLAFRIEVEGTFDELDKALRWLEFNPRLLRVDDISLVPAQEKKGVKGNLVMKLLVLGLAG
jgi:Tfp pilus assembly protein PilO